MTWCQDEICRLRALPFFLDANSAEHVAIKFLCSDVKKHPKDYFRTNISHQECLFKEFYAIGLTRRASLLAKIGYMASTSTVYVSPLMRKLPKVSLVFWDVSVLLWLEWFCRIVTVFITVETSEVTQILASRTIYVGRIETNGWGGVFPNSLMIWATLPFYPFQLFLSEVLPQRSRVDAWNLAIEV